MHGVDKQMVYRYHSCRAGNATGRYFTIDRCPAGQVMNVESAEVGYSALYNPNTNPPECSWNNCTRPTDEPARLCNGSRSCSISQEILIYQHGTALCPVQRDGNFIRIEYTCVIPGTDFYLLLSFVIIICTLHIVDTLVNI